MGLEYYNVTIFQLLRIGARVLPPSQLPHTSARGAREGTNCPARKRRVDICRRTGPPYSSAAASSSVSSSAGRSMGAPTGSEPRSPYTSMSLTTSNLGVLSTLTLRMKTFCSG